MLHLYSVEYVNEKGQWSYYTTFARSERQALENAEKACNVFDFIAVECDE